MLVEAESLYEFVAPKTKVSNIVVDTGFTTVEILCYIIKRQYSKQKSIFPKSDMHIRFTVYYNYSSLFFNLVHAQL